MYFFVENVWELDSNDDRLNCEISFSSNRIPQFKKILWKKQDIFSFLLQFSSIIKLGLFYAIGQQTLKKFDLSKSYLNSIEL